MRTEEEQSANIQVAVRNDPKAREDFALSMEVEQSANIVRSRHERMACAERMERIAIMQMAATLALLAQAFHSGQSKDLLRITTRIECPMFRFFYEIGHNHPVYTLRH